MSKRNASSRRWGATRPASARASTGRRALAIAAGAVLVAASWVVLPGFASRLAVPEGPSLHVLYNENGTITVMLDGTRVGADRVLFPYPSEMKTVSRLLRGRLEALQRAEGSGLAARAAATSAEPRP